MSSNYATVQQKLEQLQKELSSLPPYYLMSHKQSQRKLELVQQSFFLKEQLKALQQEEKSMLKVKKAKKSIDPLGLFAPCIPSLQKEISVNKDLIGLFA